VAGVEKENPNLTLRCQFGTRHLESVGMRFWRYRLASRMDRFILCSNAKDRLALGPRGIPMRSANRIRAKQ